MNSEQETNVVKALVEFIIRASKEGATAEEIAVLPAIAIVLLK